jgi:hypothetical protein
LPGLKFLQLHSLAVSEAHAPARVVSGDISLAAVHEERRPGWLARQLPLLQELVTCADTLQALAEALQGAAAAAGQHHLDGRTWARQRCRTQLCMSPVPQQLSSAEQVEALLPALLAQ